MKVGGPKNYGYGKSMKYAVRNLLRDKYGSGRYGTRRSHLARLRLFLEFLKSLGVTDLRQILEEHGVLYSEYLRDLIECDELSVSTGQNRLSSVNVLLSLLPGKDRTTLSPSEHLGKRNYVRTEQPSGLNLEHVQHVVVDLLSRGEPRLAVMVGLCRGIGCRFREASLMDLRKALRRAVAMGTIRITRGTKGGRGKVIPRVLPAPEWLVSVLVTVVRHGLEKSVIPEDMTYIQWYGMAHREWAKRCTAYGLNSRFHDLRSSFACGAHEHLTGISAPCVDATGAAEAVLPNDERLSEVEARHVIALAMGHGRTDVLNSYCGSRR